jgi:hypothetical protein
VKPDWPDKEEHVVARWLARQLLRFAEFIYLFAYGWRRERVMWEGKEMTTWMPPAGHPKCDERWGKLESYAADHAINSTKFYLRGARKARRMGNR